MVKKKCPFCDKKIERNFNYCPFCGEVLRIYDEGDYGLLGFDDDIENNIQEEMGLPFGMEKMVSSLVKQLEKQMSGMNFESMEGVPRGFKIKVTTGNPQIRQTEPRKTNVKKVMKEEVSEKESARRANLPTVNATSRVRRLSDRIIYEIEAPGVRLNKDVVITELASGVEVKIYSEEKCYVKFIPLKVEVVRYSIAGEKVLVELKN